MKWLNFKSNIKSQNFKYLVSKYCTKIPAGYHGNVL